MQVCWTGAGDGLDGAYVSGYERPPIADRLEPGTFYPQGLMQTRLLVQYQRLKSEPVPSISPPYEAA